MNNLDTHLKLKFLKELINLTGSTSTLNTKETSNNLTAIKESKTNNPLLGIKRKNNYCNKLYKDIMFETYYDIETSQASNYQLLELNDDKRKSINNMKSKGFIFKCKVCNKYYQKSTEYKVVNISKISNGVKLGILCQQCKSIVYSHVNL